MKRWSVGRLEDDGFDMALSVQPNLVSVILPTYNGAAWIGEAIASIVGQTWTNWELKVVIDGSTDDTGDLVSGIHDDRVAVIALPVNGGISVARNAGMEAAAGEYLAFIDDDDRWLPEKLERQISLLRSDSDLGLVHSGIVDCIEDGRRLTRLPPRNASDLRENLIKDCVATSAVVLRRSAAEKIGAFDPNLRSFQDWDYWLRTMAVYPSAYVPKALAIANQRPDSVSHGSPFWLARHRMQVVRKQWRLTKSFHLERRVLAHHESFIAGHLLVAGRHREARRRAWFSLRLAPSPRAGDVFILSFLGERFVNLAWKHLQRVRRFLRR